jgi:hypothetical protein
VRSRGWRGSRPFLHMTASRDYIARLYPRMGLKVTILHGHLGRSGQVSCRRCSPPRQRGVGVVRNAIVGSCHFPKPLDSPAARKEFAVVQLTLLTREVGS